MTVIEPARADVGDGAPRLVYLCDWLPPDFGAVGQYSLAFARERASAGERVTLFGLSSSAGRETAEGALRVVRIHAPAYDRTDFVARSAWTLRTNLRLLWHARRELLDADEILFTGSPPFLLHFLVPLNALLRKRLTYRITDFHPECMIAEIGSAPILLRAFRAMTVALRQHVDGFEVLGEDQRERLREIGIPPERVRLKRDPSPVDFSGDVPLQERPEALRGKIALLYSGNYGIAHDHLTFLRSYEEHHRRGSQRVVLWLNATGAKADAVEMDLEARGLPFVRGTPIPLAQLASLLKAADAHLVTLRDAFVGYVLPSKIHACLASGRPVLFIGSSRSDVDLLARAARSDGSYFRVDESDAHGAALALESLADHVERGSGQRRDQVYDDAR